MVPYLMSNHIGLCEIARGPEARVQLVKERKIEVDLLVGRTVERTRLGAGRLSDTIDGCRPAVPSSPKNAQYAQIATDSGSVTVPTEANA